MLRMCRFEKDSNKTYERFIEDLMNMSEFNGSGRFAINFYKKENANSDSVYTVYNEFENGALKKNSYVYSRETYERTPGGFSECASDNHYITYEEFLEGFKLANSYYTIWL